MKKATQQSKQLGWGLALLIGLGSPFWVQGQVAALPEADSLELHLQLRGYGAETGTLFLTPSLLRPLFPRPWVGSARAPSPHWLPTYARENPAGHAFLCRQEVRWEKSLPVGVWLEAEPDDAQPTQLMSGLRLRLRTYLAPAEP